MNNSFNKPELPSVAIKLSDDYEQRDGNLDESIYINECSAIESTQYQTSYVTAMRNNNTESVTFSVRIGTNQKANEIRELNSILKDEPVMTFVSSSS